MKFLVRLLRNEDNNILCFDLLGLTVKFTARIRHCNRNWWSCDCGDLTVGKVGSRRDPRWDRVSALIGLVISVSEYRLIWYTFRKDLYNKMTSEG